MKLGKHKDKEKILKVARDKRSLTYNGRHTRLVADLSPKTWQARGEWQEIFNVLNGKKTQPLSSKVVIQNRRRDSFPDKQNLKEFVTTKPALQQILMGTLWVEGGKKKKKKTKATKTTKYYKTSTGNTNTTGNTWHKIHIFQ